MKKIFHLLFSFVLLLGIGSCKKAETKDYYVGGKSPVLTGSVTGTIPLAYATTDQVAIKLSWTNPDYKFTTGVSSQNVSYLLEIDTTGANFTNPNRKSISLNVDLGISLTEGQLNSYLSNDMSLAVGVPHNIEIRVTSNIGSAVPLYSNILKFTGVIPFSPPPKVTPPASGKLYIVGSAVSGGWSNPVTDPVVQRFTQVSPTDYQLTIPLIGDGEYKFISVDGLWDSDKQWSIATEQASGAPSTLLYDLFPNGANARAPLTSGTYKIDVDFQKGKVTLTKL